LTYDMTFRSDPNGYKFKNPSVATLSWDLFRGTFGADEVEINGQPRPKAQTYYNNYFKTSADDGSCFGMSATSLLLYQNPNPDWDAQDLGIKPGVKLDNIGEPWIDSEIPPDGEYDPGETYMDTNGNGQWDSVRTWGVFPSFIQTPEDWVTSYQARWFDAAVQADRQWWVHQRNPTPNETYEKLKQRMASGNWLQDPLELGFYWGIPNLYVGHAVVPYKIEEAANHQQADVRIYDSNHPGSQKTLHFNLAANTASDADYNGGSNLLWVEVTDLSAILQEPQMADYDSVTPSAHLLYTDASGNHLGYVDGQFESEMYGAYRLFVPAQDQNGQLETYYIGSLDLKRELFGLENGVAKVSIMQPNSLVIADVQVTPNSHDEIQVSADGLAVQFVSGQGTSSVSLTLAVQTDNFDRLVRVNGFGVEAGSSVGIGFSADLNEISFTNNGVTKSFNIHFEQIGADPNSYDSLTPVVVREKSVQHLEFMDDQPPSLTVETPTEGEALQDGVTFKALASDASGVASVTFSIQCAQGNVISPEFQSMPAILSPDGKWQLRFDTTKLPDGYYLFVANGTDVLGNWETKTVQFSIRNWAALELLPASVSNKAGRTMPVKFSLRVVPAVDPAQPFVLNEELTIKIYEKGHPGTILQTSTYGTTARNYRIDSVGELYITNFQTLKTPTKYVVEIYRKDMLIGSFEFKTIK